MGIHLLPAIAVAFSALVWAAPATAAVGPEGKCEVGKNHESGKYALCLHKAEAKLIKTRGACSLATETDCYRDEDCPMGESCTKDLTKYSEAVAKCGTKYAAKWTRLEQQAAEALASCPDGLVQADVKVVIDECVANVVSGLAGNGLENCFANLATCGNDLGTCTGNLGTCTNDLGVCQTDLTQSQSDFATCDGSLTICTSDLGTCDAALTTCTDDFGTCATDLAVCEIEPKGQRVRTGQTQCWDSAGTLIACAGTGQDGEVQSGATPSFVDNGDGTITDQRTGLMWEKLADDGSIHDKDTTYNWTNAFAKIATLNGGGGFAGFTDWRLPNVNELQSLVNYGISGPAAHTAFHTGCAPACTVLTCSCTQSAGYWSATTYRPGPSLALRVNLFDGTVSFNGKGSANGVRGVRGGL